MKERVGFIGVGLMGHGMAKNLVEKGHPLTVLGHKNRVPIEDLKKRGASEAKTPKELAETCDVVILCVTGAPEVEALVRGKDGLKAGAKKSLVIVDTSTSEPTLISLAEAGAARRHLHRCPARAHAQGSC
jgi:3-hydroxyisobutyrate dehydrogenase-like beta-hydroxyacid dehydrogenase